MYNQLYRYCFPGKYKKSERGRATERRYRQSSKNRTAQSRWKRSPKGRASNAARRARIRNNRVGDFKLIQKIYARAQELRAWFDVVVDHIIPLAKGGAHAFDNLQIIYRVENLRKGARLGYTPSVIFV